MSDLAERLRSWAQNEEMIDSDYLAHGRDCNLAADENERLREQLRLTNIQAWVAEAELAEARELVDDLNEYAKECASERDERPGCVDRATAFLATRSSHE